MRCNGIEYSYMTYKRKIIFSNVPTQIWDVDYSVIPVTPHNN